MGRQAASAIAAMSVVRVSIPVFMLWSFRFVSVGLLFGFGRVVWTQMGRFARVTD
jgi:hypothetical protein